MYVCYQDMGNGLLIRHTCVGIMCLVWICRIGNGDIMLVNIHRNRLKLDIKFWYFVWVISNGRDGEI